MLDFDQKSSRYRKSCVDKFRGQINVRNMDDLETARRHIVDAICALEDALSDGIPAQSPRSGRTEIETGIEALKSGIGSASQAIEKAEAALGREDR